MCNELQKTTEKEDMMGASGHYIKRNEKRQLVVVVSEFGSLGNKF